jgi:putative transposase
VVVAGANIPDTKKLLEATLEAFVVERPSEPQYLCLDKGYDNPTGHAAAEQAGYQPPIRRIGEEKPAKKDRRPPPRRWVVERTLGWLSKCRVILVRYDKYACNYLGLIQLACATYWFRRLSRLCGEPVLG